MNDSTPPPTPEQIARGVAGGDVEAWTWRHRILTYVGFPALCLALFIAAAVEACR